MIRLIRLTSLIRLIRRHSAHLFLPILIAALALLPGSSRAQEARRLQPRWWFGGSLGLNLNFYSPEITNINETVTSPAPFTDGSGAGLFLAPMVEYRHDPVWGGMAALGFDSRSGSFDDVTSSAGTSTLSASLQYITVEPSLRFSPFTSDVYLFAGPRLAFNVAKSFEYTETGQPAASGDFSGIRGTVFSGQIGVGMDFPITGGDAATQVQASPFFAVHFGQGPRTEETWGLTTMRLGVSVKFASGSSVSSQAGENLAFTVSAPRIIPSERRVQETFPTRNYVFFDAGSTALPARYVALTAAGGGDLPRRPAARSPADGPDGPVATAADRLP